MISLHRYKELLREPQVAGAVAASLVGRLPIGMAVISILLFVQHVDQSFARAGMASALYVTGVGVAAPLVGRLIDRFGPRPVLYIGAAAYPVALFALIAAVHAGASSLWIGVYALLAGAVVPPIPTCIRALLRRLLHDGAHLQTAYSLDSVLMELVFIIGPGVVSVFAAAGWQAGAVACAAACGGMGATVFARSAAVRSWEGRSAAAHPARFAVLAAKGLPPILTATLFFSIGFGLFEVSVTAVATRAGVPAAAGLILALASVGSAAGALVYGSRSWSLSVAGQYKVALIAMAIGLIALAPLENLYLFCVVSVLAGAPMSTVLAAQSILIAGIAPRAALAESFTWSATSLLAGVSIGIATGGLMLERFAPTAPLLAAGLATAVGTAIAFLRVHAPAGAVPHA
jgi:MFS family permease